MTIASLLWMPSIALAQSSTVAPPHVPLQKTIGQAGVEVEPSLIVLNSRGVSMQGEKLTLTGVSPNAIVFADRPVRAAGHAFTSYLLEEWAEGATFAEDPPNATVSAFSKDGSTVRDAVVVLKSPKAEGEQVTFDVEVLEGDLTGSDGPASIFIDRFGFAYRGGFGRARVGRVGFDRVGFRRVDVGRFGVGGVHVARGGAWYRGAATAVGVGAAAATAAAAPVLLAPDASAPVVAAPVITAPVGAAPVAAAPAGSTAASGAVAQSVNPLAVLGACRPDIRSFCSTVSPGNGRIKTCMKQHLHQLSEPCKEALFQAWLQE